jgi:hypothetical protein
MGEEHESENFHPQDTEVIDLTVRFFRDLRACVVQFWP